MTSLLHLTTLIKSTLKQSYLLLLPPRNASRHLPCTNACLTPPQANTACSNCAKLTTFWWACFATARLAPAGHTLGQSHRGPAPATCGHLQPCPPHPDPRALRRRLRGSSASQPSVVLLGWSFSLAPGPCLSTTAHSNLLTCCLTKNKHPNTSFHQQHLHIKLALLS